MRRIVLAAALAVAMTSAADAGVTCYADINAGKTITSTKVSDPWSGPVSFAADGRELYQIGRIDSRTPQTLENVGKLPLGHVFSVAIPEGHRVVWVRFASHRVERLIVLSVSLIFRGVFEASHVAVAAYVRKPRTRRARPVVSAPVAQAAELTTRPTVA